MTKTYLLTLLCIQAVILSGCNGSTGSQYNSQWNNYDYRHPVPQSSGIPIDDEYIYYQDNDSYYTPPVQYDPCGPYKSRCL